MTPMKFWGIGSRTNLKFDPKADNVAIHKVKRGIN